MEPDPAFLQLSPETAALRKAVEEARLSLAHLLGEWEELHQRELPWLLALYQEKLGAWELRQLELQTAVTRARRRLEKYRAAGQAGKRPVLAVIDAELEHEFQLWQQKIAEAAQAFQQARSWIGKAEPVDPGHRAAVKKLYRQLVKTLHPDLFPALYEDLLARWEQVQAAYHADDLETLQAIAAAVPPSALPAVPSPGQLESELAALRSHADALTEKLDSLASHPPFTLKEHLADDAWIAQHREAIEARLPPLEAKLAAMEQQLQQLINSSSYGRGPGPN